jgi:hypothetical protein
MTRVADCAFRLRSASCGGQVGSIRAHAGYSLDRLAVFLILWVALTPDRVGYDEGG